MHSKTAYYYRRKLENKVACVTFQFQNVRAKDGVKSDEMHSVSRVLSHVLKYKRLTACDQYDNNTRISETSACVMCHFM